jgi:hypothetical protein|tara:strand:- start:241 stop:486 length:246 start_codon:yes stop_codon:yes gene_type:complete
MITYAICNIELLEEKDSNGYNIFDFNQIIEDDIRSLRVSNDGLYFVTKWIGATPIFLNDVETYTYAEILEALNNENWQTEI